MKYNSIASFSCEDGSDFNLWEEESLSEDSGIHSRKYRVTTKWKDVAGGDLKETRQYNNREEASKHYWEMVDNKRDGIRHGVPDIVGPQLPSANWSDVVFCNVTMWSASDHYDYLGNSTPPAKYLVIFGTHLWEYNDKDDANFRYTMVRKHYERLGDY